MPPGLPRPQSAYGDQLPPVNFYMVVNPQTGNAAQGSAHYALLPFIEQTNVYNQYNQDIPNAGYKGALFVPIKSFSCPSDPTQSNGLANGGSQSGQWALSCYSYNLVLFGGSYNAVNTIVGRPDNTWPWPATALTTGGTYGPYSPDPAYLPGGAFYGANYPMPQCGVNPTQADPTRFQSCHTGLLLVGLMDGSVRPITAGISQYSWNLALNPADGMVFDSSW